MEDIPCSQIEAGKGKGETLRIVINWQSQKEKNTLVNMIIDTQILHSIPKEVKEKLPFMPFSDHTLRGVIIPSNYFLYWLNKHYISVCIA